MKRPDMTMMAILFCVAMIIVMTIGFAFFALGVATTYIPVQY
jgi:hypothetical protein